MGKRKTQRKGITIQCKYGEDDDLIEWYESLPQGNRQSEVMRILRLGLGIPTPPKKISIYGQLTGDDIERLIEQRFDELWTATQREIRAAFNSMDYAPQNTGIYESVKIEKVDEETLRIREANMKEDTW